MLLDSRSHDVRILSRSTAPRAGAGRGRAQQVAARVVSADEDFGPHPIYEWAFHAQLLLHKQALLAFGFWEDRLVFHYSSMTHEGKCPNDVKR